MKIKIQIKDGGESAYFLRKLLDQTIQEWIDSNPDEEEEVIVEIEE